MLCQNIKCNKEHDGSFGSGKYCTRACANSRNHSKETKLKISKSLYIGTDIIKECIDCKKLFNIKYYNRKQKFCNNKCKTNYQLKDIGYMAKISKIMSENAFKRHLENKSNFGWQSRKNLTPSYPESIAIKYFIDNNINFEREFKFKKYFIDFVLKDFYKIAIEIDGTQHLKPERIKSDNRKDELLLENNWKIFRIKYPTDNIKISLENIIRKLA